MERTKTVLSVKEKVKRINYFDISPEERANKLRKDLIKLSKNRVGNYEAGESELEAQRGNLD